MQKSSLTSCGGSCWCRHSGALTTQTLCKRRLTEADSYKLPLVMNSQSHFTLRQKKTTSLIRTQTPHLAPPAAGPPCGTTTSLP